MGTGVDFSREERRSKGTDVDSPREKIPSLRPGIDSFREDIEALRSGKETVMTSKFRDYKADAAHWITLASGEFYPDILTDACKLYRPVLELFGQLLKTSESSKRVLLEIADISEQWIRIQLARVFRKYVSPTTPVEMLKKKRKAQWICDEFGKYFRPVVEVQKAYNSRPMPDEALCAILWEYKDRGSKGYDMTEKMFELLRNKFPSYKIVRPERAGRDVLLGEIFENYPKPDRPVDFIISKDADVLAVGLARYDSDRGGAQEDDRTGGYLNASREILEYAKNSGLKTKVIFVNRVVWKLQFSNNFHLNNSTFCAARYKTARTCSITNRVIEQVQ